uniref:ABC transporter G family member 14 n=1 Tax=Anthurium amnicola TaxID=1678845 RepID=A0A1D1YQK7_9ARAE
MCREEKRMPSLCIEGEEGFGGVNAPPPAPERRDTTGSPTLPSACSTITLEFTDVSYRIKVERKSGGQGIGRWLRPDSAGHAVAEERSILSGITGMACPGEILAILGPSGSGKSTLLNVLGGRLQGKHGGSVLANGGRLTRGVARRTGFVTQDDVLYPHLTVRETLVFCALLRLPGTLSREEKVRAAEGVITELGLAKCENTIIGNSFVRGVSGGERKRVSIGHEMLLNPSLLLADEPTSGLDSTAAHRVVATLAGLAQRGKTVVASIHQPSSRVYQMFDKVLLLSEGSCLYFGRGRDAMDYFASLGLAPRFPVNPADFMLDLANGVAQVENQGEMDKHNVKHLLVSSCNKLLVPKVKACMVVKAACEDTAQTGGGEQQQVSRWQGEEGEQRSSAGISWFSQFSILLQRGLKERRHEAFNQQRVLQVVAAAVLAGSMWWRSDPRRVQDRLGLLFFVTIFWGVFPSFNGVFTFPQERAIFAKERASGMYTLSSYFMARTAGDLPMELALPTVFVLIIYWMGGLKPDPFAFILSLLVVLYSVLVSQSLGLAIGAILMDVKQATTLASVTTLVFLIAGGYYVQHIPTFIVWFKYLSYSYYCYKLLIGVQFRENDYYECSKGVMCRVADFPSISSVGLTNLWADVCIMALMLVGYRLLAYLALRRLHISN